jgi:RiboL-PSP-HEPN
MTDEAGEENFKVVWLPRSQANYLFHSYPQVSRLLEIHRTLGGSGPGRRVNLEVLNKSAIVTICAFWEAFVEDLSADALRHLADHSETPDSLPLAVRKAVSNELRAHKHELAMWDLAGEQWRELLRDRAEKIVSAGDRTLSSPNSQKVNDFFLHQSGVENISKSWRWSGTSSSKACQRLDSFIALRNSIAHRGGPKDETVLRRDAAKGFALIDRLCELSVGEVNMQITKATGVEFVKRFGLTEIDFE